MVAIRARKARAGGASLGLWLAVAALWLIFDQFTKYLILAHYQLYDSIPVTGFSNVVRVHNYGAAFSFLAGAGGWQRWFFTGIGLGALAANAFVIGSAATTADHRIIYDATTGALFYDADGDGAGAAMQFATLGAGLALTNADFVGGP